VAESSYNVYLEKVSDSYKERKSADKQYVFDLLDTVFNIKAGDGDIESTKC